MVITPASGIKEKTVGIYAEKAKTMNEFWVRAADYYRNPKRSGGAPNYTPLRAAMSLDTRYAFNPFEHMEFSADMSFLVIMETDALYTYFSESAVKRGKEVGVNADLFKIKGVQHFDLYDQDCYVDQTVIKLDRFFSKTLK